MPALDPTDHVKLKVKIPEARLLLSALRYIFADQAQPSWWYEGEEQAMFALIDALAGSLRLYDELA